ncbi:MAG TPA: hypothetical protein VK943_04670, partial [Arenibaculum sp.]|nr:hypothetical protein [Arenibaculum sp.]
MPKDSPTTPAGRSAPAGIPRTVLLSARLWLRALMRGFKRKYARNNEILIVVLAAVIGSAVGFAVVSIQGLLRMVHDLA